jgi:hypothetical protein
MPEQPLDKPDTPLVSFRHRAAILCINGSLEVRTLELRRAAVRLGLNTAHVTVLEVSRGTRARGTQSQLCFGTPMFAISNVTSHAALPCHSGVPAAHTRAARAFARTCTRDATRVDGNCHYYTPEHAELRDGPREAWPPALIARLVEDAAAAARVSTVRFGMPAGWGSFTCLHNACASPATCRAAWRERTRGVPAVVRTRP